METKICKKCGVEKTTDNFIKYKKYNKEYIRGICKNCENERIREYRRNNKEILKQKRKKYYDENPLVFEKYRERYKEKRKKLAREYYKNNKEKIQERIKIYNQKHKAIRRVKERERKKEDKIYKLKVKSRLMIKDAFKRKNKTKNNNTTKILCCDIEFFTKYLLQTFKDNYGYEWDGIEKVHIDHIKPLKYANTEEEVIQLCHYTNLQLLKAKDNLEKRDTLDWGGTNVK